MKRKFWNWVKNDAEEERTLILNGEISDETWYGDEVTPKLFEKELNAGTRVLMSPVGLMMIHNPMTIAIGDSREMQKAGEMLDEVKESILNAYEIKTGLNRTKISRLMDGESWFNAKKAVELGFVDGILGSTEKTEDAAGGIGAEGYVYEQGFRTEGEESKGIPEIPVAVIREVLANSFAHAIYNSRTTHEICIHPGMITAYSPGEYASKHKPEEYIKDNIESEIRNAAIAKILYLSKSIEQFGSGFKRINSLCNDAGIKYSYENRENGDGGSCHFEAETRFIKG